MQLTLSCPIHTSYRVQQIAGMFDVPIADKAERIIQFDSPPLDDPNWKIGCVVGPSGSGKTSIAKSIINEGRENRGERRGLRDEEIHSPLDSCPSSLSSLPLDSHPFSLTSNKAVIDCFGNANIKDIVNVLTLVGFSSPPSWIKPYSVLSNGEQFRCDLARALLRGVGRGVRDESREERREVRDEEIHSLLAPSLSPLSSSLTPILFDEFTSVVDRNVARIASAAISKAIKSGKLNCQFIAVTCHYDVLDWLEPDWVLDTATGKCQKVLLRRPNIELEIFRCERNLWNLFKTHHYLSGTLSRSCRCYAAFWQGKPITFCALIPQQGFERWYRVSRIVTLPDYQGIGIGSRFLDSLAEMYVQQNYRFSITASHPSIISHCKRSGHWKATNVQKTGSQHSRGRGVVSFEWKG